MQQGALVLLRVSLPQQLRLNGEKQSEQGGVIELSGGEGARRRNGTTCEWIRIFERRESAMSRCCRCREMHKRRHRCTEWKMTINYFAVRYVTRSITARLE